MPYFFSRKWLHLRCWALTSFLCLRQTPMLPGSRHEFRLNRAYCPYPYKPFMHSSSPGLTKSPLLREAVVRRRPVLTTFRLSNKGWRKFCNYFHHKADTAKSVLTHGTMAPYHSFKDGGGHAVVMVSCSPGSLTFLNSWGRKWGDSGSFSVESHTVLQRDGWFGPSPVCFYDVYWLENDLTEGEQQAFSNKAEEILRERAKDVPGIFKLGARCPLCRADSPIAQFKGNIRKATCPRCHGTFAPGPGHLMQALYARAGLNDLN